MAKSKLLRELEAKYSELEKNRSSWHSQFMDAQNLVHPNTMSFTSGVMTRGGRKNLEIFDATAPLALIQFAAGLHSYLTSPGERWFTLRLADEVSYSLSSEELIWLEETADRIYHEYNLPTSSFNPSLHELYMALGGFGTGAISQELIDGELVFRAYSLGMCYIDESASGFVDTMFRRMVRRKRQLIQEYPELENHPLVRNEKEDREYEVIHAVMPNKDYIPKMLGPKGKPFASYYFCKEFDDVLKEGGYDSFPYHVPRWTKLSGETYGRGPGEAVMPDIKMINAMSREIIYSAQLANSPPVVVENDSLLLPVTSLTPKSILYKEPGTEFPQAFNSGMQPQLSLELMEQRREVIRQAFFVDYLLRPKKKERQTAVEIMDDRSEMLRQMGPMIARIQDELLGPLIRRTYSIMDRRGDFSEPPASLESAPLKLVYTSPAANAQMGTKAAAITQYLQDLSVIGAIKPEVFNVLDEHELAYEMASLRDVTHRVLRTRQEWAAAVEAEKQAAAEQQQVEALPQAASALKDVASARESDPTMVQNLLGG